MIRTLGLMISICMLLATQLTGCGGKTLEVTYYSLTNSSPQIDKRTVEPLPIILGIGPVSLPQLLKRPHLVTRSADYRVEHAEFDRWSGDLQEEIIHALAENLSEQLGAETTLIYPWAKQITPDWQVKVDIQRLDGELEKVAYLEARWMLKNTKQELILTGFSRHQEAIKEAGYEPLVAAQNRLLTTFSRELEDKIRLSH